MPSVAREENKAGNMYNLVGFQTNLKFPEAADSMYPSTPVI